MALRMAEYALLIYRKLGRFPRQFVLYVGEEALRMSPEFTGPRFRFEYELVDIRQIDADEFLQGLPVPGTFWLS